MRMWVIPMVYVGAAVSAGLSLPRLEQAYLASDTLLLSVGSAQAYLSAAASGMMALTGIVFAMGFVMVQFSAIAYSPRLVLWFAWDPILFHSLGIFSATFIYALFTLAWVDRGGAGGVPLFSSLLVGALIIVSLFLFSKLIQRLGDLQISNVLHSIGDRGRAVIGELFPPIAEGATLSGETDGTACRNCARTRDAGAALYRPSAHDRQDGNRRARQSRATGQRDHRDAERGWRHVG